jgi:alkylhydroperoxidase/carboxymuconolactone decarboxylase family protein YurZ
MDPLEWALRSITDRAVEDLVALDPAFADRARALYRRPGPGSALTDRERALLEVSLDAVVTQLAPDRLECSIAAALEAGCEVRELVAVLEVTHVIGLHTMTVGLPLLFAATAPLDRPLDADEEELVAQLASDDPRSHQMSRLYESLIRFDATYLRDFIGLIDHPWAAGTLSPRMIHLVCILIDVACSHLYEPGLRLHIDGALEHGASPTEVFEVMQIASRSGMRTIGAGFDALLRVLEGGGPAKEGASSSNGSTTL